MGKQMLKKIGLIVALLIPAVVSSAAELDQVSLSKSVDELAISYFDAGNPGCAVGVIHQVAFCNTPTEFLDKVTGIYITAVKEAR